MVVFGEMDSKVWEWALGGCGMLEMGENHMQEFNAVSKWLKKKTGTSYKWVMPNIHNRHVLWVCRISIEVSM